MAAKTDVSKADGLNKMVERMLAEFGRVDILVNNADLPEYRIAGFAGSSRRKYCEFGHTRLGEA
ncbi:MAG: SDR family NAD(P)-dependent oxidoreductase [Dehalococcoidia bacterium]